MKGLAFITHNPIGATSVPKYDYSRKVWGDIKESTSDLVYLDFNPRALLRSNSSHGKQDLA